MKKTYIKGIDIATIKPDDKVWCKQNEGSEIQEGVVTEVDYLRMRVWVDYGNGRLNYIHVKDKDGVDKYGFMCGTIKEEEEMKTSQNNKHPQYDVIVHWASGGNIQYYNTADEKWEDCPTDYKFNISWGSYGFRIKPDTKKIKYRTALLKNNTIKVFIENLSLGDAYGDDAFKQWLDPDWKELEVEV